MCKVTNMLCLLCVLSYILQAVEASFLSGGGGVTPPLWRAAGVSPQQHSAGQQQWPCVAAGPLVLYGPVSTALPAGSAGTRRLCVAAPAGAIRCNRLLHIHATPALMLCL
jgi:hypothetical protein